jgi:hypothetical protein
MRIRTCLLAAFGLVVPLIAMFSHLIPSGVADSLWQLAWQPAAAFFDDASSAAVRSNVVHAFRCRFVRGAAGNSI